jgi:hypothetical protein
MLALLPPHITSSYLTLPPADYQNRVKTLQTQMKSQFGASANSGLIGTGFLLDPITGKFSFGSTDAGLNLCTFDQ